MPEAQRQQHNSIYKSIQSSSDSNRRNLRSTNENHEQHDKPMKPSENDEQHLTASNIQITPNMFMNMCPALLVQIEQGACAETHLLDDTELTGEDDGDHDHHTNDEHYHEAHSETKSENKLTGRGKQ